MVSQEVYRNTEGLQGNSKSLHSFILFYLFVCLLDYFNSEFDQRCTLSKNRHHHNGRWEARIGRVFGNKYLYLGTYSKFPILHNTFAHRTICMYKRHKTVLSKNHIKEMFNNLTMFRYSRGGCSCL